MTNSPRPANGRFPQILSVREQSELIERNLKDRLDTLLPKAMREAGIDMWIILCQEDDHDPVYKTMIPMNTWSPILQILVFYDRGEAEGIERVSIAMTNMCGLHEQPWEGRDTREQWDLLGKMVADRDPKQIGVNTGCAQWAAGGLTLNLYDQLFDTLSEKYVERLTPAEVAATAWLAVLTDEEVTRFGNVVEIAKSIIADCYSRETIVPDKTTIDDVKWHYWQTATDLGLELAFLPYFTIHRSDAGKDRYGEEDRTIRPGDLIHCDVGIKYLRLNSDHQQWAYILRPGESEAPDYLRTHFEKVHQLQDIFMDEFRHGLSGNELLRNILDRAKREGVPGPKIYSHSLGYYLHEPGPLIGLPWEQECCPGRGDVKLDYNNAFTMELSVTAPCPEWSEEELRMSVEEDVVFTKGSGCHVVGERQTEFHLI